MDSKQYAKVIAAGLALFSMFFGAGDLIWPLILGGASGNTNLYAVTGLLITGVTLPLLGLVAMMLYEGNYHAFFGVVGRRSSFVLIFIIQAILGPIGSIPRLITLTHATLKPYFPCEVSLPVFSILAIVILFALCRKPQKVITVLGLYLTPILLLSLGAILVLGFWNHPAAVHSDQSPYTAFSNGLAVGYNTLDLIASFIFAPFVLSHFVSDEGQKWTLNDRRAVFKNMVQASMIAAALLSCMYLGLTFVLSYYTPWLESTHSPEERLSLISLLILGPYGAFFSCIAVAMACLTTAIPLVSIFSKYVQSDLAQKRVSDTTALLLTLGLSGILANLGFMGIANLLGPVLQILCPGLIVLSVLNIFNKLFETRVSRIPVVTTFALSTVTHLL